MLLESVNWIHLAEDSGERRAVVKAVTKFPKYVRKFRVPYFLGELHE
jgi:RNase P/RNase MRP subunit p30